MIVLKVWTGISKGKELTNDERIVTLARFSKLLPAVLSAAEMQPLVAPKQIEIAFGRDQYVEKSAYQLSAELIMPEDLQVLADQSGFNEFVAGVLSRSLPEGKTFLLTIKDSRMEGVGAAA